MRPQIWGVDRHHGRPTRASRRGVPSHHQTALQGIKCLWLEGSWVSCVRCVGPRAARVRQSFPTERGVPLGLRCTCFEGLQKRARGVMLDLPYDFGTEPKVSTVSASGAFQSPMAKPDAHACSCLVQCGSERWKSGVGGSDERVAEAGAF
jgi:hypothetical protein